MADAPLRVAVILSSTREGRFGPTVAHWYADRVRQHGGMEMDLIDLAEEELPSRMTGNPGPEVAAVTERLDAADAFTVVTPEYNHSFPAPLKTAIDWHYAEWQAKPVSFVSYGGVSGGLRAVEQLRLVFAEVHAVTMRDTVSFAMAGNLFDSNGQPTDPECNGAAKTMLDQLSWWGHTLREGRGKRPYAT